MHNEEKNKKIDITKNVLHTIEDFNMKPKPKWHFVLQEAAVWSLGVVTTFFGAVAVSVTLFALTVAPVRLQPATHDSVIKFWFEFMPTLWLILFVAFIFATDYFLRKTKRGYKYSFLILTMASVFLSVLLGTVGFFIGLGELVEKRVGPYVPYHNPTQTIVQKVWLQPAKGLLTGSLSEDKTILETKDGDTFKIDITGLPEVQQELLSEGNKIGLIGTTTESGVFHVCMIIPFENKNFMLEADQFERKISDERSNTCKGVRPYDRLKTKVLKYEN